MRISELSKATGVSIATIKFYQRERLLPPGELSSPTQASYDASHIERIALIRALIDIGDLSVASARDVIAAIDDPELPLTWTFGIAQRAISAKSSAPAAVPLDTSARNHSTGELAAALAAAGIEVYDDNPGLPIAIGVLDAFHRLGHDELTQALPEYLRAAQIVAEADLAAVGKRVDRADMAETVVIGTVLGDALSAALRRIAQEAVSRVVFPPSTLALGLDHDAALFPPTPHATANTNPTSTPRSARH